MLSAKLTAKTSRPLSAVKRSANTSPRESEDQKVAVLSAVHNENIQVSEYLRKKESEKKVTMTFINQYIIRLLDFYIHLVKLKQDGAKVNGFTLSNDVSIGEVEKRVLQMEPQQQRDLMKTLHQLERTVRPSSTALISRNQLNKKSDVSL